jgi:hypothetical protein
LCNFSKENKNKKRKKPWLTRREAKTIFENEKKNTMWQIGQANSPVVCQLKNGLTH